MFPIVDGSVPAIRLVWHQKTVTAVKEPISDGMDPVNELVSTCRFFKLIRLPIIGGIVP
jgi:hypothetical protein